MKNKFEDIMKKAGRATILGKKEKENMRAYLQSYIKERPIKAPVLSGWVFLLREHVLVTAMICLLVLGGAGSVLAEGALPGDLLYGFKTSVNEQVRGWFATSADAKAQWQLSLAQRRFDEIEKLSEENKLTPEVSADLEEKVDVHAKLVLGKEDTTSEDGNISQESSSTLAQDVEKAPKMAAMSLLSTEATEEATTSKATTTEDVSVDLGSRLSSLQDRINNYKEEVNAGAFSSSRKTEIRARALLLISQKEIFRANELIKEDSTDIVPALLDKVDGYLSQFSQISIENDSANTDQTSAVVNSVPPKEKNNHSNKESDGSSAKTENSHDSQSTQEDNNVSSILPNINLKSDNSFKVEISR